MNYVLGFAFLTNWNEETKVVLIRKTKPDWQRGKLNGVGGKIEPGEYCNVAMAREFEEETGYKTAPTDWVKFTEMRFTGDHGNGSDVVVHCFAMNLPSHAEVRTTTEEEVECWKLSLIPRMVTIIPNLHWLVPMALYAVTKESEDNSIPHTLSHV